MADTEQVWTYIGRRIGTKDRVYYWWQDDQEEPHAFSKQLARHASIGGRYTVTATDDGQSVFTSGEKGPKYVGKTEDDEQLLQWQLADRSAVMQDADRKQQKRDGDRDLIREALLPIRRAMASRRAHVDKAALFNAISAELWRPLDKDEVR